MDVGCTSRPGECSVEVINAVRSDSVLEDG